MRQPQIKRFTVSGDMLRYDCCWPATERDSAMVSVQRPTEHLERTITLATYSASAPTCGRWESFGWHASDASEKAF